MINMIIPYKYIKGVYTHKKVAVWRSFFVCKIYKIEIIILQDKQIYCIIISQVNGVILKRLKRTVC